VKGIPKERKEIKPRGRFLRQPRGRGKVQKSVKDIRTVRERESGLSKWKKQLLEACENEEEEKAVASIT
jgi:hypothetical protein